MKHQKRQSKENKRFKELITYPIPFPEENIRSVITIKDDEIDIKSGQELVNKAIKHHKKGNILDALKIYESCINRGIKDSKVFSNYGIILKSIGELIKAETSLKEAIKINPKSAETNHNMGLILKDLGKLGEAEKFFLKAISIKPDYTSPYLALSTLKYSKGGKDVWQDYLFSINILNQKKPEETIDIYFARSNILHKEKKYIESAKYLQLANSIKLNIRPSKANELIKKTNTLLKVSNIMSFYKTNKIKFQPIFIIGMPRSGSTLVESIISINSKVKDLGELKILEKSYHESLIKKDKVNSLSMFELYSKKISNLSDNYNIITDKMLYNYQFAGIISKKIPNAKIIHCFRNPLDNILSIYRANFTKGNGYASSLVDIARVYLDQEKIMKEYKKKYRSKIYDLNYDLLVKDPNYEIRNLIQWLSWKWNDAYLFPHLNSRSVSTASNVQVRSPINQNSIGGWRNYKEMLRPAIQIIEGINRKPDF